MRERKAHPVNSDIVLQMRDNWKVARARMQVFIMKSHYELSIGSKISNLE